MAKLQLLLAGAFLIVAAAVWVVFLRPASVETSTGVIRSKTFRPAGTYVRYQPGSRPGFVTPTTIPSAEHFVIGIQVPGQTAQLQYAANLVESASLAIGDTVRIVYQRRGIPLFWQRVYVLDLKRAG